MKRIYVITEKIGDNIETRAYKKDKLARLDFVQSVLNQVKQLSETNQLNMLHELNTEYSYDIFCQAIPDCSFSYDEYHISLVSIESKNKLYVKFGGK